MIAAVKINNLSVFSKLPWKLGIVGFMAYPQTLKEEGVKEAVTKLLEEEVFEILEFHLMKNENMKVLLKLANDHNVEVALALQPMILMQGYELSSLDKSKRKEALKKFKEVVDKAHEYNINKIALCTGRDPGAENREKATKGLIDALTELCEYAKEYGISIYLENFDREYDKKLLLGPTLEAANVIRSVRKEVNNIWLLWDLSHAPLLNEKPEILKEVHDILGHIHIGCAEKTDEGLKDYHPVFYTKNSINDVNDVATLLEVLLDIGYKGAMSFEIKPKEYQTSEEIVNVAEGVLYTAFIKVLKKKITH